MVHSCADSYGYIKSLCTSWTEAYSTWHFKVDFYFFHLQKVTERWIHTSRSDSSPDDHWRQSFDNSAFSITLRGTLRYLANALQTIYQSILLITIHLIWVGRYIFVDNLIKLKKSNEHQPLLLFFVNTLTRSFSKYQELWIFLLYCCSYKSRFFVQTVQQ